MLSIISSQWTAFVVCNECVYNTIIILNPFSSPKPANPPFPFYFQDITLLPTTERKYTKKILIIHATWRHLTCLLWFLFTNTHDFQRPQYALYYYCCCYCFHLKHELWAFFWWKLFQNFHDHFTRINFSSVNPIIFWTIFLFAN